MCLEPFIKKQPKGPFYIPFGVPGNGNLPGPSGSVAGFRVKARIVGDLWTSGMSRLTGSARGPVVG